MARTIAPQESLHRLSPDAQTRWSDGGLTLFPSQRFCQTLDKTEVFSACGYVLYYWCACRRSRASAAGRAPSLVGPPFWVHFFRQFVAVTRTVSRLTLPDFDVLRAADHEERSPVLWVHVVGTLRGHILEQFRPFNSAYAATSCWQSGRTYQARPLLRSRLPGERRLAW